jgi:hypothetical protein
MVAVVAGVLAWTGAVGSASPATSSVHASAAKPPVLGRTVLVAPVSGRVFVRLVGAHVFLRLKAPLDLPVGSVIDTRHGSMSVTEAGVTGRVDVATVDGGRAIVTQQAASAAPTTFRLSQTLACGKTAAAAAAKHAARRRHIRVTESDGNWDTCAQYVATAAEGTNWTTTDTCDGSTVTVRSGLVTATNLITQKTVTLTAGEHLTVTAPRHRSPPPTRTVTGSLSNGAGSALAYSIQTNTAANGFKLILPSGVSVTSTSAPSGFSCTDTGNVEACKGGTVQANAPVIGSFDHTGTIAAKCGRVHVAFSADNGATWSTPATLTGPQSASPPPTPTGPTISGSFSAGTMPGTVDYGLDPSVPINGYKLIAPTGDGITSNFASAGWSCKNRAANIVECEGPVLSSPFTSILNIAVPTLSSLSAAASTDGGVTWGPTTTLTGG